MAVYSRYRQVLNSDGSPLTVRTALALINRELDETLAAEESDLDADSRWAVAWFAQYAHEPGPFGEALTLATAKGVGVDGLRSAGIVESGRGKVRLRDRTELREDWSPAPGRDLTVWQITQHLIRTLERSGDAAAERLVREMETARTAGADAARDLAYRLHAIAERKGWAEEAQGYNALVAAWPDITARARDREGRSG
jgi:putative DNA methylase